MWIEQLHKTYRLCGSPSDEFWRNNKLPHAKLFKPREPYRRCLAEALKDFPPAALQLIDKLLSCAPDDRGTVTSALGSEFFTAKPFACDPSSLPKYPPSKEIDIQWQENYC
ncbi:hypothetical protein ACH5RR_028752 [Cinchona calisaya]|uniref:Uncharacterized protein n=1 Tax=Cinchona calisaya TaxID=153742 RepID=A0ABD2YRW4_9GENT